MEKVKEAVLNSKWMAKEEWIEFIWWLMDEKDIDIDDLEE